MQITFATAGLGVVERNFDALERKFVPASQARAANRVAVTIRRLTAQDVSKLMGLKQKKVRPQITIDKATKLEPSATVTASGKHISLIHFGARQRKAGVSASAWGLRKIYKGTFIGKGQGSAATQVFARTSKDRLPIKKLYGPSIPKIITDAAIKRNVRSTINKRLPIEFERDLAWRVSRFMKRRQGAGR